MRSTFKILFYLKKNNPKPNGAVPVMEESRLTEQSASSVVR